MEKCEGSNVFGRHILKCEHNVNMYLKVNKSFYGVINWSDQSQDRGKGQDF